MSGPWTYFISAIAVVALAIMAFAWAVLSGRSRGHRRCPKCWYSMNAAPTRRCPECGHEVKHDKQFFKTRINRKAAMAGTFLALLSTCLAVRAKVEHSGVGSVVPVTALIALLQYEDSQWIIRGIDYQMAFDIFARPRRNWDETGDSTHSRALCRWQWRWLGGTVLSRLDDPNLNPQSRTRMRTWLVSCRDFAGDPALREQITNYLHRAMTDSDPWVRGPALVYSVDFDDIEGSIARALPFLDDDASGARWGAIMALRSIAFRDARGVELLLNNLAHDQSDVRVGAMTSLSLLAQKQGRKPEFFDALVAMKDDPDCFVRQSHVGAMARLHGDDEAWELIAKAAQSDSVCLRRGGFMASHGRSPVPASVLRLAVSALSDRDATVRQYASWLLCRDYLDFNALTMQSEQLKELVESDDPEVQRAATSVLNRMKKR